MSKCQNTWFLCTIRSHYLLHVTMVLDERSGTFVHLCDSSKMTRNGEWVV